MLDTHPYMGNVYIMKDLPRSERGNRRGTNTLNEAANSGGNRTQGNLGMGDRAEVIVGNINTLHGEQRNANSNNRVGEEVSTGNNSVNRNGLADLENGDWTEASFNRGEIARGGRNTGDAIEPGVQTTQPIDTSTEEQSAGDGGAERNMRGGNNSGNEQVGEGEMVS